jgi:hypothetical protein
MQADLLTKTLQSRRGRPVPRRGARGRRSVANKEGGPRQRERPRFPSTIRKHLVNVTLGACAIGSLRRQVLCRNTDLKGTNDEEVSNRGRPCDSARRRRLGICGAGSGRVRPGQHGLRQGTYIKKTKTLHLEKNCATATNAAAGADITGVSGQTFQSASFTLASAAQCQGGSPRFNVVTTTGLFFLGCNNVTPTTNANGTATYTFTAATLAAAGQQVPTPTGTIQSVSVLIDVQGMADLTKITFNGKREKLAPGQADFARPCKKGGWKSFTNPTFKNQGQCVKFLIHGRNAAKKKC